MAYIPDPLSKVQTVALKYAELTFTSDMSAVDFYASFDAAENSIMEKLIKNDA